MSENRANYNEACPICATGGKDQKLFLDMDAMEIRCEDGHKFDELPSDSQLRTGQPAQTVFEKNLQESLPEAEAEKSEPVNTLESVEVAPEPRRSIAEVANEMAVEVEKTVDAQSGVVSVSGAISGSVGAGAMITLKDVPSLALYEGQAVTLPDGDMLLCIRIPEVWKQAVEAEAQAQMRSPAAYFGQWLTSEEMKAAIVDFLQNYWSSAYSQTV